MELLFVFLFLIIVCFMFGYFIGYNKGFKECEEIKQKYTSKTEF